MSSRIEVGMLFDSVRALTKSDRWRVTRVMDNGYFLIQRVARRVGPPPPAYVTGRTRNADRFDGWELKAVMDGEEKVVHYETLTRPSDYVRFSPASSHQQGFFA